MNTATVLYSFVGRVVTNHGARLTAMGQIKGPPGAPFALYEKAADATADLIGHRPDPRTGVALNRMHGVEFLDAIQEAVRAAADVWCIAEAQLYSRERSERLCKPRFVLYRYLNRNCGLSTMETGKLMNKDHGSVINGIRKLDAWEAKDSELRGKIAEFNRRVGRANAGPFYE